MVLNPHLYAVLQHRYGEVRVFNENVRRVEDRLTRRVTERGESYNVCCPLCGDERFRLSISYLWLTNPPLSKRRVTALANCYNEDCDVRRREFWEPIAQDVEDAHLGLLDVDPKALQKVSARTQFRGAIPLPEGCVPLLELDHDHLAWQFLRDKYGWDDGFIQYVAQGYDLRYAEEHDDMFPSAQGRIIFPIVTEKGTVAWQGRATRRSKSKWFLPPGFIKVFYNGYRVLPHQTPVLCEGITNAITCGPTGIAMFGKGLNSIRAEEFSERWKSVILATDPDTFCPNNRKGGRGEIAVHELRDTLAQFISDIRLIRWPEDVMELARRHNNDVHDELDIKVPDAADLGPKRMHQIVEELL